MPTLRPAYVCPLLLALLLSACGSAPKTTTEHAKPNAASASAKSSSTNHSNQPNLPKANSGRGAYYKDDGPGDNTPPDLESTVDPIPMVEAYSRSGNKAYVVFGKTYTPITDTSTPFKQRGIASWYGKKFHGQKTSSGELYDMYKITAAHPTLPIPSYARVTNLDNGKQIIVRINDRGPFHSSRIIDLSYTAALKLAYLGKGSSQLEVERLLPDDIEKMAENRKNQPLTVGAYPSSSPSSSPSPSPSPVSALALPSPAAVTVSASAKTDSMSIESLLASQEVKAAEKIDNAAASATPNFYIQLGAFAIRANAEASMERLKAKLASRLPDFDIVQQGSLYRLISGPFSTRAEATSAIAQNGDLGVGKPVVVQR
ncbi:septal ring lytic transglycosylase RlpA family protein [Undibacterium parvum]|uniref:Endolytic peptidoglycan transglycosylase RlpA n=2 Tax=Undibacterium parvum TaxID=401471 RepID=A0A3S9HQS7_9BURK|nr:septal ring lytic transglycosylase RlpA family protein [Undibacterium parvum]